MKNLTRREFLEVFASFAALAAFALPRPKGDAVVSEAQRNDKALLAGIERANERLIDNANFDVELEAQGIGRFEDMTWTPGNIEPGATVYLSWDKGNSWEHVGNLERLLDSCECASSGWRVECKQCEPAEAEYAKCTACKDGKIITDFDCYDLGNCDSLCASEHIGAAVDRKARDEQV